MDVYFYEKPGCINNTKQKLMLRDSGHKVKSFNLFEIEWSIEELKPFFYGRPVVDWFNMSAPRIKNGDVKPETLSEIEALKSMVEDHYLIKRPLLKVGDKHASGFDSELANDLIKSQNVSHLLTCPKSAQPKSCDDEINLSME